MSIGVLICFVIIIALNKTRTLPSNNQSAINMFPSNDDGMALMTFHMYLRIAILKKMYSRLQESLLKCMSPINVDKM